ncbi:MAG: rhomboid family intramembrane serine protease [Puniceicoccales bacterium]|jgi:membrane associated rhomboid family serine protease|nr:rhomboid family intramembrane serine protease [Puniceicoccales bacterium]
MSNWFILNTRKSATTWLFIAIACCYLIQTISKLLFGSTIFFKELSLSVASIKEWNLSPLLTYPFLHEGLLSLFFNTIALLLLGRAIEGQFGPKRLLAVFFTSSICGGLAWLCLHWRDSWFLSGSLVACLGLLSYFCSRNANKQATFFLFFVLPISLKPKHLLIGLLGIEILCMLIGEILNHRPVTNSANLGGMIGGMLCYLWFDGESKFTQAIEKQIVRIMKKQPKGTVAMQNDNYNVYITSQSAQKSEIDRILDKINESGFESLSNEERNTLNSAKQVMRK